MTSEQKVKRLWPGATIEARPCPGHPGRTHYQVTIAPGRYAYGAYRSLAWVNAWDSITQDEELSRGAPKADRRDAPEPKAKGPRSKQPGEITVNYPHG